MKNGLELYTLLRQHTGGGPLYRHSLIASFNYTPGVRDFARFAGNGAYWLLDILATEPSVKSLVVEEGFAVVILKVGADSKATLTVAADTGAVPVLSRKIDFTDCPQAPVTPLNPDGAWKFYLEVNGTTTSGHPTIICMLPQER